MVKVNDEYYFNTLFLNERMKQGLSQIRFGKKLSLSKSYISAVECKRLTPSGVTIIHFLNTFGYKFELKKTFIDSTSPSFSSLPQS